MEKWHADLWNSENVNIVVLESCSSTHYLLRDLWNGYAVNASLKNVKDFKGTGEKIFICTV
jgi:hypothetical protein